VSPKENACMFINNGVTIWRIWGLLGQAWFQSCYA